MKSSFFLFLCFHVIKKLFAYLIVVLLCTVQFAVYGNTEILGL